MMSKSPEYDVAIIGAGPAGAATARRLTQHGCRVLLIEYSEFEIPRVGETLAPSVKPLLDELGVWEHFIALNPLQSWGTSSIWGTAEPQQHSHLMNPYGYGWHIDRQAFDFMMAESAKLVGAELRTGTRVTVCEQENGVWRLILAYKSNIDRVSARVIIDATGRGARLAHQLGAQSYSFDRMVGVAVQFTDMPNAMQCYTLVETTSAGWWYSAPAGDDRLIVMFMTDSDLCSSANLTLMESWLIYLQNTNATVERVANAPFIWGPRVFSAVSQRLKRKDTGSHWLAVGDATLAVDPASGSGVVRALRTANACAVATLELLHGTSCDIIQNYEADRDKECILYLQDRAAYYGMEQRWQKCPFWQRRISCLNSNLIA